MPTPQLAAFLLYAPLGWSAAAVGDVRHYLSISRALLPDGSSQALYVPWAVAFGLIGLCGIMAAYTAYMFNVRARGQAARAGCAP